MDSLYIVIPAYNEQETIERVVNEWYPVVQKTGKDSKLVLINDGSKDKTYEIICRLAKDRPLMVSLTKPNGGHGPTVIYGYKYAIENGADYVFQTDSDGQTNPQEFDAFWALRKQYDVILGKRMGRRDGASRVFTERVVCLLLRLYFGVKVPDANAPFRLMKSDVLSKYVNRFPEDYNLPNIMLTAYFVYYRERVAFREISFAPRQGGVNSIDFRKIVKIGFRALRDFHTFRKSMREN